MKFYYINSVLYIYYIYVFPNEGQGHSEIEFYGLFPAKCTKDKFHLHFNVS